MTPTTTKEPATEVKTSGVLKGETRGKIWEQARGMWKDRKPDPIKELNKMRREMDRKLP